ncbi:MAG: ParA family protein [Syntrophothermus sp.]
MGKIFAVVNQKGGVGKTTTVINLGACLAEQGRKVLMVDVDPQGNTSSGIGIDKSKLNMCIYDVLINERQIDEVKVPSGYPRLDLVPARIHLAGAEIELVSTVGREFRLKEALKAVRDRYDYILLDCPPSLGLLTLNALAAADGALVPIQCEYFALEGLSQLLKTIELVQRHLNPSLQISGVVMTMFDARTNLAQQVIDEVKAHFGEKVFATVIPRNIRLSEAPSFGQPVIVYDGKSRGALSYQDLAKEVIARG